MWHLARVVDANGEAIGYRRVTGYDLLCNQVQEAVFEALPARFSFKDAKQAYGRGDQPTANFLRKAIAIGILVKITKGVYEKV